MPKKSVRRSTTKPDAGDELGTLAFYFVHVELLQAVVRSLAERLVAEGDFEQAMDDIQTGHPLPVWSAMMLHFATLYTVIEGWRRLAPGDPEIDRLVANPFSDRLRDLRDGVFHYGAVNSPALLGVLQDRTMIKWSTELERAFAAFFAKAFPGESHAGRVQFRAV